MYILLNKSINYNTMDELLQKALELYRYLGIEPPLYQTLEDGSVYFYTREEDVSKSEAVGDCS